MNEATCSALWHDGRSHSQTRSRPPSQRGAPRRGRAVDAGYLVPASYRSAIINELIVLFDGPAQREAQRLAAEVLGEAPDSINYH